MVKMVKDTESGRYCGEPWGRLRVVLRSFLHQLKLMAALLIATVLLAGCGASPAAAETDTVSVVCTIFPQYDWVRVLLDGVSADVKVTLLSDDGTDIHSYQPSVQDMAVIQESDLLVYIGGDSEDWLLEMVEADEVLKERSINLLELMGELVLEEEEKEGMTDEIGHVHDEDFEAEDDEHVWLSFVNARVLCGELAECLIELLPEEETLIRANLEAYEEQVAALEEEYVQAVASARYDTLLFGDRFPFRYLTEEFGLDYYAAFAGCNADAEASFETIVFLIEKLNELDLPAILIIEGSDSKLAETIRKNTQSADQEILTLNSMQAVSGDEVAAGATWLNIMEENLKVLKTALGSE
ncbi:MAG: metal ABC transporter substrate-binding protein [Lachnospiraceae bacterium]|nr:metal ABC transporter substrate-binding protein [Lachnospiraceae bacterium]